LLKKRRILTVRRHVYPNPDIDTDPNTDAVDTDAADTDADIGKWRTFSHGSVLLRINMASRVYVLNFYRLLFPGQTKPNLYFNPEYDTVYLPTPWDNKPPHYALPEYPQELDRYKLFAWMLQKFM